MAIQSSVCKCGRAFVPVRIKCPMCGGLTETKEIGNDGTVLTFTTVQAVPDGFTAPLHLAVVLLSNGAKLLCESRCNPMMIGRKVAVLQENDKFICTDL